MKRLRYLFWRWVHNRVESLWHWVYYRKLKPVTLPWPDDVKKFYTLVHSEKHEDGTVTDIYRSN